MIADMFKSPEVKAREAEEKVLDEKLAKVKFFPGTQEQYELMVDYPVRVVDTKSRDKGVKFKREDSNPYECWETFELKKRLVESGVEAIINGSFVYGRGDLYQSYIYYGLPVARR